MGVNVSFFISLDREVFRYRVVCQKVWIVNSDGFFIAASRCLGHRVRWLVYCNVIQHVCDLLWICAPLITRHLTGINSHCELSRGTADFRVVE